MFVEERQNMIIDILREKGRVRVKELSARFKVTEDLIRKDLTVLEEKGLLKKAYGGAVLERENVHRESVIQRKGINIEEKKKIARKAISFLKPNMIIFLDISTINVEVAELLTKQNISLTVVTNMIEVMRIVSPVTNINLIFIGGELDYGHDGFVGSLANKMISDFRFDVAFMGVVGVHIDENAVFTYMPNDGLTKKEVLCHSKISYILCESDKFKQTGSYRYANISDYSGIITDQMLDVEMKKQLEQLHSTLFIAS